MQRHCTCLISILMLSEDNIARLSINLNKSLIQVFDCKSGSWIKKMVQLSLRLWKVVRPFTKICIYRVILAPAFRTINMYLPMTLWLVVLVVLLWAYLKPCPVISFSPTSQGGLGFMSATTMGQVAFCMYVRHHFYFPYWRSFAYAFSWRSKWCYLRFVINVATWVQDWNERCNPDGCK